MALWNCASCVDAEPSSLYKDNVPRYKVILLGNSGVGKTALLNCLNGNEFTEEFLTTIGVEFTVKTFDVDGIMVRAKMWDTAGQRRNGSVMSTFYKMANGVIFVYDVTDRESFEALNDWEKEFARLRNKEKGELAMIVIGNKSQEGLERQVTEKEGQAFAEDRGMMYAETSARGGINVVETFDHLIQQMTSEYNTIHGSRHAKRSRGSSFTKYALFPTEASLIDKQAPEMKTSGKGPS